MQKVVETMAGIVRGKKFETTVAFPTIPGQTIVETLARFMRIKKSLKQRLDFQQS